VKKKIETLKENHY